MDLNRIDQLASGVEWYLKQLSNFTEELKGVREELKQLRLIHERNQDYEIEKMREQINALTEALKHQGISSPNEYEIELDRVRRLMSENWPLAIADDRICNTENKQKDRANGIVNLFISEYLKDKRFLDFGCGDGFVVEAAQVNEASFSIGYDIKNNLSDNVTNDWNLVVENSPYDIVLLHDVLDHIEICNPIEALLKVKSVLSPDGRIYVRNHPWSSRHGGHLYLHKNLAFLHLVMDEVELTRVGGLEAEYNIKVITPLDTYRHWFDETGFKIDSEMVISSPIEDFFKNTPCISSRLSKLWPEGNPYEHMKIDFVEYVLSMDMLNHQIF